MLQNERFQIKLTSRSMLHNFWKSSWRISVASCWCWKDRWHPSQINFWIILLLLMTVSYLVCFVLFFVFCFAFFHGLNDFDWRWSTFNSSRLTSSDHIFERTCARTWCSFNDLSIFCMIIICDTFKKITKFKWSSNLKFSQLTSFWTLEGLNWDCRGCWLG